MSVWLKKLLICACIASSLAAPEIFASNGGFPEWLAGEPDVNRRAARCGVYAWFFEEADIQTAGQASTDSLASMRVINIANKLVDYHLASPANGYSANIRFLVFGRDRGPFHFDFKIGSTELDRIINDGNCD